MSQAEFGDGRDYFKQHGFSEPLVIKAVSPIARTSPAFGLRKPPKEFGVTELAEILKPGFPVNCINVAQQASNPEITTVGEWADYMTAEIPPGGRKELNNLISLEFTSTPLEPLFFFSPPAAVNTTLSLGLQISRFAP